MAIDIKFEMNGFLYKATSYDEKKNILYADKFENNNFINKTQLRFGELPKKVKQQLNPLKK